MKMSVRFRALLLLVIVPILLVATLFATLFLVEYRKDFGKAREQIRSEAENIRGSLYIEISKGLELLRGVAANPVAARALRQMGSVPQGLDNDDFKVLDGFAPLRELMDYVARGTDVDLVYAASPDAPGLILGRDLQMAEGFDVRGRDYFQGARATPGTAVISAPRVSAEKSDTPVIVVTAARAVTGEDGRFLGLIAFNYRLNRLIEIIRREMEAREVVLSLYDTQSGQILWHIFPDKEYFFDPNDTRSVKDLLAGYGITGAAAEDAEAHLRGDVEYAYEGKGPEGPVLIQTIRIPDTRWAVNLTFPRSRISGQILTAIFPPLAGFFLLFLVMQIAVFFLINRGVVSPIVALGKSLQRLAEADADLTVSIPTRQNDEIGLVAASFNAFIGKLRSLMSDVKNAIQDTDQVKLDVSSSAEETSAAVEEISANIASSGNQMQKLDQNIDETVTAVEQITRNIASVDSQITRQSEMVEQSTAAITEMMASLNNVSSVSQNKKQATAALSAVAVEGKSKIDGTATAFRTVEAYIQEVQEMAASINSIAAQTNLLSMNAAIEAAHAGDSGRGFAVVAEEIRKLADSAGDSSKGITQLLRDITSAVIDTGKNMSLTSETFDRINKEVEDTVHAFAEIEQAVVELNVGGRQILESSEKINEVTLLIKAGSEEMTAGTRVLLDSATGIKNISAQVTSGMEESSSGAREIVLSMQRMVELSQRLSRIVDGLTVEFGRFRT